MNVGGNVFVNNRGKYLPTNVPPLTHSLEKCGHLKTTD